MKYREIAFRNKLIYVVAIRIIKKLSPWNQNVQQDGEMAARMAAPIFVNIKLNDPFCNWVMSYLSNLFVHRRLFILLSSTLVFVEYLRSFEP